MKKRMVIVLLGAVTLLLSACGNQKSTVSDVNSTEESIVESVVESVPTSSEKKEEYVDTQEEIPDYTIDELDDSTCRITDYNSDTEGELIVPSEIYGKTVVEIGSSVFYDMKMTSIVLPDTVEKIDTTAFLNCENLKHINFGQGLKSVEDQMVTNCPSLESASFPDGMIRLGAAPFFNCDNLKEVYIPESVTEFGDVLAHLEFTPNIVIVTPSGSAAEAKALEEGIPVKNA